MRLGETTHDIVPGSGGSNAFSIHVINSFVRHLRTIQFSLKKKKKIIEFYNSKYKQTTHSHNKSKCVQQGTYNFSYKTNFVCY